MALRVYRDPAGDEWRVWRVMPDSASFATLDANYRDGWLCFERTDGTGRRRLSIGLAPAAWESMPESTLDQLRLSAEPAMQPTDSSESASRKKAGTTRAKRRR
jgi:hypothetical protein